MSYFEAAVFGVIQGLTEFLPISSSGHLVLAQELMGRNPQGVTFELLVHLGSLLAVIIYFRSQLWLLARSLFVKDERQKRKEILFLIVGTLPAGLFGILFEDFFDRMFSSPAVTSGMLIVTGLILYSTKFIKKDTESVKMPSALAMGLAQALAIMPGISRSGSTISMGMLMRVSPSKAAEFSFLLSIPAIAGATVFKFDEIQSSSSSIGESFVLGAVVSFVFSLIAIHLLLAIIRKGRFESFAYYCFAVGALGLYLFL